MSLALEWYRFCVWTTINGNNWPFHLYTDSLLKFTFASSSFKKGANVVGPVAQWITRLTTDQKIPGSNPGRFVNPFQQLKLQVDE